MGRVILKLKHQLQIIMLRNTGNEICRKRLDPKHASLGENFIGNRVT